MKVGRKVGYDGSEVRDGLGYTLGTARASRGLSLRQVASVVGIYAPNLSQVEHGTKTLAAKHVVALAKLYGLNPTTLAGLALQETHIFKNLKKVAV